MLGSNFAPVNWALCNGQSMPIAQNDVLYNLIGTTYGGDGVNTFNLPNLQGRLAVGVGQGPGLSPYTIGQVGGSENVTLTTATMPSHNHTLSATTTNATLTSPTGNLTGTVPTSGSAVLYTGGSPVTGNLAAQACTNSGGNQPHSNLMPSLCLTFIIALYGIYPSQS
ncbi:MAG: tail fiber protein, partial [Xanthobacteraceae bacterium]